MTIVLEAAEEQWPQIGRGGHLRNAKGQALVIPPGGGRKRLAIGGSGLDVFYNYTGPSGFGEQGSHVHTVTEYADAGKPVDELIAPGEAVGVPGDVTRHCYDSYLEFIGDLGWTTALTECVVVNDNYSVPIASNIDKVMLTPGGHVVVDVKSANSFDHRGYAMQLAAYVESSLYDPLTGERTPLPQPLETSIAYIMSYTVRVDRMWKLVEVDVPVGLALLQEFDHLRKDERHKSAFRMVEVDGGAGSRTAPPSPIAAPSPPSPSVDVEQPAGGDEGTANASSLPATLDGLKALVGQWEPEAIAEFNAGLVAAGVPKGHPKRDDYEYMAKAIERYTFGDVATEPVARNAPMSKSEALRWARDMPDSGLVDEGHEVDAETVRDAGQAYARLPDDKRSWVSMAGAKIRLNPDHGGKPTERRATLLGALCELADQGMDDDDAVRAIAAHLIGDIAWQAGNTTGDVVAALDVAEAHRFAAIASLVCMSLAPFEFQEGAVRCALTDELKAAA